jgi:dipeptidyl aminopeptidase/acylaminoacyl peptidase
MSEAALRLIRAQVALGDPALSADGSLVAYTRRTVERNAYRTRIWVVPARAGRPRALTAGAVDDAAPAFTPAGDAVLFLRERQVHRVRLADGVCEQLTALPLGVDAFAQRPDGRALLLTAPSPEPRFAVGPLEGDTPPLARVLRRLDWRLDGSGVLDRHAHLWLAAARPGARVRRLFGGDRSARDACWSPDGTRIAFVCDPDADGDLHPRPRVFTLAPGEQPVELAALAGACRTPAWSPGGQSIAFRGNDVPGEPFWSSESVFVVASDGGAPRDLAPGLHLYPGAADSSDLLDWRRDGGDALAWEGEQAVRCLCTGRGHTALWRLPLHGSPGEVDGAGAPLLRATAQGDVIAMLEPHGGAAELAVSAAGRRRVRTRHGSAWAAGHAGLRDDEVEVPGPAGPIRTRVLSPAGADGPLPTVLSIIGGPGGSWGETPWLPDVALAVAGYRVLRPDPRGSGSYGRAWLEAIEGAWGGADADDQLAVCDWAIAEGLSDPERQLVWGLSYGGFMTSWLVGHGDRFRAAVSINGVSNQVSSIANCDVGVPWAPRTGWGLPPDDVERLWAQSPLAYADRIRTPLLLLQGEQDLRCPPADNEQLFTALRARGRDVEYVLYPEESHLMQAIGRPDRRIDMLERALAWFARHAT